MGFNKKVLSKAVSELGKAKAPAKPKDIITDPAGQWKYPGQKTRIPSNDITMQGVPYPVWAQPNVGPGSMMQPNQDYNFPNASYVDETPMAKKGGTLQSKKYSKSMSATNKLFAKNKLFKNMKSKIFDPNAEFKNGGEADYEDLELTDEEIQAYRDGGYVVEEEPEYKTGGFVQHELVKAQTGLATTSDSLSLYNNAIKLKGFYDNLKPYYDNPEINPWYDKDLKKIQQETLTHPAVSSSNKAIIKNNKDANAIYMSDMITGALNPKAPLLKYDTRIKPQGEIHYIPKRYSFAENVSPDIVKIQNMAFNVTPYSSSWGSNMVKYMSEKDPIKKANSKKELIKIGVALKLKDPEKAINGWIYRTKKDDEVDKALPGYITTLPYYDPLAIKPANMLSDNEIKIRFKKYGASGIPQSKLKTLGLSSSIQSVKPIDKKPVDKKILDKNGNILTADYLKKHPVIYVSDSKDPNIGLYNEAGNLYLYKELQKPVNKKPVQSVQPVKPVEEVTPLKRMFFPQVARPEQEIIPAAPYKKPVHYAGPRYGTWSDGSTEQFPQGLNTSDWERKTKEYQQQQRGTQPIVTRKQGGILDKAQGGKIVYSGPKFGLVGPSTPKTNGAPTIANAKILETERQKAALAKQQAIAKQKEDKLMRRMPKTQVSDNTRTVIPKQAISDINNAAFYNSPQETANREARKKEQADFEKEQWNKYNKMSFAEKALDRTQATLAHPFLMAGNALAGNQGYIPGMGRGLMDTESPEYDKYLKATGQTKGQFEVSDFANIVNPGYWAGNAGNELHKGNYIKGVTDLGFGLMGLKGAKNASGFVKGSANALNKAESKISKLIPERAPNTSVNTGSTLNAGISPQLIKNTIGPKNKVLANLADYAYFAPFLSKTLNKYNPLHLSGLGTKLEGAVKPLGNVLGNSIKNGKLTGGKSLFGKTKPLSTQVGNKNLNQIYAAKFDGSIPGSQLQLSEANPQGWFGKTFRKPTYSIQNKAGNNLSEVPLYDQGVELFRKYPFMNRYGKINKQKLMNGQFQWSTTGAGLQNVAEKYGKTAVVVGLGAGAYNAYNYDKNKPETFATPEEIELVNEYNNGQFAKSDVPSRAEMFKRGAEEAYESPLDYAKNPYFVNDIYQGLNPTQEEKNGGSIESWEDDLDEEEIRLLKEAGFIVEELK